MVSCLGCIMLFMTLVGGCYVYYKILKVKREIANEELKERQEEKQ